MNKLQSLKISISVTAAAIFASVILLYGLISTPENMVKLRNSFLFDTGTVADFTWKPDNIPKSYLLELQSSPPEFLKIAETINNEKSDVPNFTKSLNIASHLVQGPKRGEGLLTNTLDAYQAMTGEGGGYGADFTQVFNGIAHASGIPVREWGMAFDGFGGNGHAFSEIYDRTYKKWVMLDSFFSFYVKSRVTSKPLSTLEFQHMLRRGESVWNDEIEIVPIDAEKFSFKTSVKALEYYYKGKDQMYLWWGNNVFSYDSNAFVTTLGPISRSLEQVAAIVVGVHPRIRILKDKSNKELVEALGAIRTRFFIVVPLLAVFLILFFVEVRFYRRLV